MFSQIDKREHDAQTEEAREEESNLRPSVHRIDRGVA